MSQRRETRPTAGGHVTNAVLETRGSQQGAVSGTVTNVGDAWHGDGRPTAGGRVTNAVLETGGQGAGSLTNAVLETGGQQQGAGSLTRYWRRAANSRGPGH